MYVIDRSNGNIIFPDGFVLACPYEEDERYIEYAAWIHAGGIVEYINGDT